MRMFKLATWSGYMRPHNSQHLTQSSGVRILAVQFQVCNKKCKSSAFANNRTGSLVVSVRQRRSASTFFDPNVSIRQCRFALNDRQHSPTITFNVLRSETWQVYTLQAQTHCSWELTRSKAEFRQVVDVENEKLNVVTRFHHHTVGKLEDSLSQSGLRRRRVRKVSRGSSRRLQSHQGPQRRAILSVGAT